MNYVEATSIDRSGKPFLKNGEDESFRNTTKKSFRLVPFGSKKGRYSLRKKEGFASLPLAREDHHWRPQTV
jgi:hypothetical protein